MNMTDRAKLATRAKHALLHLEKHPNTTREHLGTARDRYNNVLNAGDDLATESVHVLEDLVTTVYGGVPTVCPECRCFVTDQTTLDGIHTASCTADH